MEIVTRRNHLMVWNILLVFLALYVIYSRSTIKYQLNLISKYFEIKGEKEEEVQISNEIIEKEIEDEFNK